jgi:hypothetical protein
MDTLSICGVFITIGFIYIFYFCYRHAKWYGGWKQFFYCLRWSNYTKIGLVALISWLIILIINEFDTPNWLKIIFALPTGVAFGVYIGTEDNIARKDNALNIIEREIAIIRAELIDGQGYLNYKEEARKHGVSLSEKDEKTIQEVKKDLEQDKIKLYDLEVELRKEKEKDLKLYKE